MSTTMSNPRVGAPSGASASAAGVGPVLARWVRQGVQRRVVGGALGVLGIVLLALLGLALLDVLTPLPLLLRLLLAAAALGVIGGAVVLAAVRAWRAAGDARRGARAVETGRRRDDNALINAVQVAGGAMPDVQPTDLEADLIHRVRQRGRDVLRDGDRRWVVTWAGLRRGGAVLVAAVLLWLGAALLLPEMLGHQLQRFAAAGPGAARQVGPYTPIKLELEAEPTEPLRGEDVRLRAQAAGGALEDVTLVELDAGGHELRRLAMNGTGEATSQSFERQLVAVTAPMRVRAEAGRARSRVIEIVPRDPATMPGDAMGDASAPGASGEDVARRRAMAEAYRELGEALDRLAGLHERAGELAEAPQDVSPQSQRAREADAALAAAAAELAALAERFAALRDDASSGDNDSGGGGASGGGDATQREAAMLAARLADSAIRRAGSCPGGARAEQTGGEPGQGVGGGVRQWAGEVRDAARADLARMNRPVGGGPGPYHGWRGEGGQGDDGPAARSVAAFGTSTERVGSDMEADDAVLSAQRVPSAYRELAAQYLRKINEDQSP